MKILRQKNNEGVYSALVSDYCCDNMRMTRGIFNFNKEGKYHLKVPEVEASAEARFCPFCSEPFEIKKVGV